MKFRDFFHIPTDPADWPQPMRPPKPPAPADLPLYQRHEYPGASRPEFEPPATVGLVLDHWMEDDRDSRVWRLWNIRQDAQRLPDVSYVLASDFAKLEARLIAALWLIPGEAIISELHEHVAKAERALAILKTVEEIKNAPRL